MAVDQDSPPAVAPVAVARFLALDETYSDFDLASDQLGARVGRKKANDIVLGIKRISGMHAELRWVDGADH